MAYYVLGKGGAKHGPAELHTLNDWISQGRISPETLIEDTGGTKIPARAVRGLHFPSSTATPVSVTVSSTAPIPVGTPLAGVATPPLQPTKAVSNYVRPGLGTGGSDMNLFLPAAHAKWATQGFLSAGGGVLLGIIVSLMERNFHFELGRLTFIAFGLPIFGVRSGYIGLNLGQRGRATLVILANVVAFLSVLAAVIIGYSSW